MDSLRPFLEALGGLGAAGPIVGLMAWLFWQERIERKELSAKVLDMNGKMIEAEQEMTQALTALAGKLGK